MKFPKLISINEASQKESYTDKMCSLLNRCIDSDKNLSVCDDFKFIDCEIDGNQIIMYVDVKDGYGRYERKIFELNLREVLD